MEVRCSVCNQKYVIPDDRLAEKMTYFACEKCGSTVSLGPRGRLSQGAAPAVLSAKDMLEGIYLSFNLKNLLISAAALFSIGLLFSLIYSAAVNNTVFVANWPGLFQALACFAAIIALFAFDLHLYLISKNTAHRIKSGGNILFFMAQSEIINDLKPVSIISAGVPAAFILIMAPLALIGNGGILYAGLVYPALIVLSVAVVVIQTMKGLILAFIALIQRTLGNTFREILHFLAVENINLPLYLLFINIVSGIFFLLLAAVAGGGMLLAARFFSRLAGGEFYGPPLNFLAGGVQGITSGAMEGMPAVVKAGIILILIFSLVLILFAAAYFVNLYQTLSVVSVSIMEARPGRSISRAAILASMIGLGLIAGAVFLLKAAGMIWALFS
jgi:hypothetical protein